MMVGKQAPEFDLPSVGGPEKLAGRVRLLDYRGRWLVILFYPRDFSLVCPTELTALGDQSQEFRRQECELLGISSDSIETHRKWLETARSEGGIEGLDFPLASDESGSVAHRYGVWLEEAGVALRGLFLVDPEGLVQYAVVHNVSVGRRPEEVLRVLSALQTGGLCPGGWKPGDAILDPGVVMRNGSLISHYRIEGLIGRGSFATVFRAWDIRLERSVALKVLRPGTMMAPALVLAEARTAASLNHPNVCTVYGVDDTEGVPMIAMEYVDGRSLGQVLKEGALEGAAVCLVGRQVAAGLGAAHAQGIVHGDMKPENVLVTPDWGVRVVDFGLARRRPVEFDPHADTAELGLGEGDGLRGTPGYMAPEQLEGNAASEASDVFALGAMIYEMATGRRAFPGPGLGRVMAQISQVDGRALSAEAPPGFQTVLRQALEREPINRPTMAQIEECLAASGGEQ